MSSWETKSQPHCKWIKDNVKFTRRVECFRGIIIALEKSVELNESVKTIPLPLPPVVFVMVMICYNEKHKEALMVVKTRKQGNYDYHDSE